MDGLDDGGLSNNDKKLQPTNSVSEKAQDSNIKCNKLDLEENVKKEHTIVNEEYSENTELETENVCFSSSLLKGDETRALLFVLNGIGVPYSRSVGPHISHLVVGTQDGRFQNTYKVLLAMALHKPIIRFDWVREVLRNGGTVPLDPYVALDPSGECGVIRAKADKKRELLKKFAIHIYNVNDKLVQKEQIEELVKLCGATVVKELNDFHSVSQESFRLIIISEESDITRQGDLCRRYAAVEVQIDWIYTTIGCYRVVPLLPFLVDPNDAVSFLKCKGYPQDLIAGVTSPPH